MHYPDACHVSDPAVLASDLRGLRSNVARNSCLDAFWPFGPKATASTFASTGMSNDTVADRVVVAAGIWSRRLAKGLGDSMPLDTERGYNATYPHGSFGLDRPIMFEGEGFVTSPLATGDRVGGAVEFGGHRRAAQS